MDHSSRPTPTNQWLERRYSKVKMRFQSFFMSTAAHFIQRCGIQGFVEASEWCVAVVGAYGVSVMDNQTSSELPNAAIGGQRMNSLMKLGPGTPPNGCREIAILLGRAHAGPLTDVRYWPVASLSAMQRHVRSWG